MAYLSMKIHAKALYHKRGLIDWEKTFTPTVFLQGISSAFTSDPTTCGRGVRGGFLGFF